MTTKKLSSGTCVFSVDVEDWFHILDSPQTPRIQEWDLLPSRVERNFYRLLDLAGEHKVSFTCFFLGWIAKKFPWLVKEAFERGHEIGSHGNLHQLAYEMTQAEFYEDARISRQTLEDISGTAVAGFRAAGFSATNMTPWFFDTVLEAGYHYDSSVFPASHGHGGVPDAVCAPHFVGELLEFPVSVARVLGQSLCFFGGGHLRVSPLPVIRAMAARVLLEGRPLVFYVHPREIDPAQPRLPMSLKRRFKSYVNLKSTEKKITRILTNFRFVTFATLAAQYLQPAACAPRPVAANR